MSGTKDTKPDTTTPKLNPVKTLEKYLMERNPPKSTIYDELEAAAKMLWVISVILIGVVVWQNL